MLSKALLWFRNLGVGSGLLLLALFPLPPTLWSIGVLVDPQLPGRWPRLAVFLESLDAGAQQPLARSLLRTLCAGLGIAGLFLPSSAEWRRPSWMVFGIPFLALGWTSALLAPHRFQALRDWEMWALAGVVVYTVASQWRPSWGRWGLCWLYCLTAFFLLQASCMGLTEATQRLGGPFHHPNAYSTFCLMALAVTLSRSFVAGAERRLAQVISGAWLGLAMCAGSLTGGCILVGGAALLACERLGKPASLLTALLAAASLLALNLQGGWVALLALPSMLVALWLLAIRLRTGETVVDTTWLVAVGAALVLLIYSLLAPGQVLDGAGANRRSSGQGRLQLYRSALAISVEHPLLGVGPGGFSRDFPARQDRLGVFSKFPHCLPLELASEWGLPATILAALLIAGALRAASVATSPEAHIGGRVLAVFLLHSATDVQTQFPYLLVLAALALGLIGADKVPLRCFDTESRRRSSSPQRNEVQVPTRMAGSRLGDMLSKCAMGRPLRLEPDTDVETSERDLSGKMGDSVGEDRVTLLCRTALSLVCLGLLSLNLSRVEGSFDRALATTIARRTRTPEGRQAVTSLLSSSFDSDPLDSESARLWGLALADQQQTGAARGLARFAVWLDPRRASCRLLLLEVEPPPPHSAVKEYQRAIELDPINYPTLYRWMAETLWGQAKEKQALEVLRRQAEIYVPTSMDDLFSFREGDLEDQLVEFHALKAALEESARPKAGEPDWRLALQHCQGKRFRLERLRRYLGELRELGKPSPLRGGNGLTLSRSLADRLQLFLDEIPAQEIPGPVQSPPHDPKQL